MKILNLTPQLNFQNKTLFEKLKGGEILTISPLNEIGTGAYVKCEIGALAYVLAMIVERISPKFSEFDSGFLSGESSVGEEEIEEILEFLDGVSAILVDENELLTHKDSSSLKAFLNIISLEFRAKILNLNEKELDFSSQKFSSLKELDSYDGAVVFKHSVDDEFVGGKYFTLVAKISDGDRVKVKTKSLEITKTFKLDESIKGTVALLGLKSDKSVVKSYAYEVASISKVW